MKAPDIYIGAIVIDTDDIARLAGFYQHLLELRILRKTEDFIGLEAKGGIRLYIQHNPLYRRPVWPDVPGQPQAKMHLDFACADLGAAIAHAIACGAQKAPVQYLSGSVVMTDPAGHPFCLYSPHKHPDPA